MPDIYFVNEKKRVSVNAGTNIRTAAKKNGVELYRGFGKMANCHGLGLCGECVIEVVTTDDVSPAKRGEDKRLTQKKMNGENRRLACQCQVFGRGEIVVKTIK